jgi:hypothetical protein
MPKKSRAAKVAAKKRDVAMRSRGKSNASRGSFAKAGEEEIRKRAAAKAGELRAKRIREQVSDARTGEPDAEV